MNLETQQALTEQPPKRYSVSDPRYQYLSSKNIYWDKLKNLPPELQGLAFLDHDTETHRGNWRGQFQATNATRPTLHVEMGCNAGHVTLEWAQQNPNHLYIGIDYKLKQIYRLAQKASKAKLKNLISFRAHIDRLPFMFAEGEIDFLYLYFPDPWPKKGHQKNRTFRREWLKNIAPLLSPQGVFHVKTDHPGYFEFMLEEAQAVSDLYDLKDVTWNLHEHHPQPQTLKIPEVTLFERLFIKDGLPIHSLKLYKK